MNGLIAKEKSTSSYLTSKLTQLCPNFFKHLWNNQPINHIIIGEIPSKYPLYPNQLSSGPMFHCSFAAYLNNCMGSLWAAGMRVSLAVPGVRNGSVHGKPWSSRTNSLGENVDARGVSNWGTRIFRSHWLVIRLKSNHRLLRVTIDYHWNPLIVIGIPF